VNVGTLIIPERFQRLLPVFRLSGPTAAGISGGRTSALMHALTLAANQDQLHLYTPCFANTGTEDPKTLVFLKNLDEATSIPVTWMEFQPPEVYGAPPRFARSQVVTFDTAERGMRIWYDFLGTLAVYREREKGQGPTAPSAFMRLCTSYMKLKTIHRYVRGVLGEEYDYAVGLRADEPGRVASLKGQERGGVVFRTPLEAAGIVKEDVLSFWRAQPFDLELPEYLGNCTYCFLKDEPDLSTIMREYPAEGYEWIKLQDTFGDFRRGHTSLRTIQIESSVRLDVIRPAVERGGFPACPATFTAEPTWLKRARSEAECAYQRRLNKWEEKRLEITQSVGAPLWDGDLEAWVIPGLPLGGVPPKPKPPANLSWTDRQWAEYRWKLLIRQEQERFKNGSKTFSCACESAQLSGVGEDE
jgi:hypothetical protein